VAQVLLSRGLCYLRLGDYSSAMADFTEAEKIHPQSVFALWGRAKALAFLGQVDEAIECMTQLIDSLKTPIASAYQDRAMLLSIMGRIADAKRASALAKEATTPTLPELVLHRHLMTPLSQYDGQQIMSARTRMLESEKLKAMIERDRQAIAENEQQELEANTQWLEEATAKLEARRASGDDGVPQSDDDDDDDDDDEDAAIDKQATTSSSSTTPS